VSAPERPLGTYVVFMAAFSSIFGGLLALAAARDRLPTRPSLPDLALAAVAGHKLARLIATDEVTSPIRAPFVEARVTDDGDVVEQPTGMGVQRAFGELLICPSCVGQWTCAAFITGIILNPRPTRAVAAIFATDAISDFLHTAFHAAKDRA
jgi:hypothetical protein